MERKDLAKRVILVTGTPCVGKTSAARLLTSKLDALYINLTELAVKDKLTMGKDEERDTIIVDEDKMKKRIRDIIEETKKTQIVIDGHYAVSVVPPGFVSFVFVLRRDPVELREFMKRCGFSEAKRDENLESEILDLCLVEALNTVETEKICEMNVTGKTVVEIVDAMLDAMVHPDRCSVGAVDWLGKLESEGLLDEFLKT